MRGWDLVCPGRLGGRGWSRCTSVVGNGYVSRCPEHSFYYVFRPKGTHCLLQRVRRAGAGVPGKRASEEPWTTEVCAVCGLVLEGGHGGWLAGMLVRCQKSHSSGPTPFRTSLTLHWTTATTRFPPSSRGSCSQDEDGCRGKQSR